MTDDNPTIEVTEGGVELPVIDVLTGRGAIFGKSGSGKSNTVGVIAEQLLEQNFPLLIIDKDGEHYGLKEEHQLLHVGADDSADAVIGPEHAETLARLALDENVPIILDVSGFLENEVVDELVRKLVTTMFNMEKKRKVPFPIFIEEAHELIPQKGHPDETAKALIKVAKRGRKHGLGITAISQRPANVNKDLVTQADWTIWHLLTWKNDTQVVRDVLTPNHAQAVQDLEPGEALLDLDWEDEVRSVKFKRKRTFDAGQTPGLDDFERPELQPVDDEIMASLTEITEAEAAEEDRVAQLEAERDRLESTVADLRERIDSDGEGPDSDVVETLREEKEELEATVSQLEADLKETQETLERRDDIIESLRDEVEDLRWARDTIEEARDVLGVEMDGENEEYRDRIETLEKEVRRLENEAERLREQGGEAMVSVPDDYEEFYENDTVETAIEDAIANGSGSKRAVWAAVLTIANNGGPATYDEIREQAGYSDNTQVSKAVNALDARDVITVVDQNPKRVDFAFDAMQEIARKNRMREEMNERIEQKVN